MNVSIIVAKANNNVIGVNNQLPWHLPNDLKYFKQTTLNKPILMGRKTYESIGKPLPQRTNIILTRNQNFTAPGCIVVHTIQDAMHEASKVGDELMVIGGANIYTEFLPLANKMYVTLVDCTIEGDAHFDDIHESWQEVSREAHHKDEKHAYDYSFVVFEK